MTTLNLVDHLLGLARKYQELGQVLDALKTLTRLAGFRELPAETSETVQISLAELQLKRRKYHRARRHLTAVLRHQPNEARYHYLMGTACLAEGRGDPERAAEHFQRSLELDPKHVKCLVEGGVLSIRMGRPDEGLGRLRQAAELAPDDPFVIGKLARGLRQTGKANEAKAVLRAALFRNPRVPRFRKLWNDFQFQQLRQKQELKRLNREELLASSDEPVLLPFVRLVKEEAEPLPDGLRRDGPATVPGPHLPRTVKRPDQSHVQ
jgi:tetratricopeptide (TPR) repeat protein